MKVKKSIIEVLLVSVVLAFSASAAAKDLRLGLIVPNSHAWTAAARSMAKDLKEQSDGKYTVSIYPSGQLGSEARMLQQLQTGALDMAFLTLAEITNRAPEFGAFYEPYLVENVEQAGELLNGPTATKMLENLPSEAGVVGVGYGIASMRVMLTNFRATSAEELSGRKIRITPFPPVRDFYNLLGAAFTPMPLPDVYDALANGQVDGVDADMELVWKLKLYQRAQTVLNSNHMMFPVIGLVSGRLWAQLSESDRKLISGVANKHLNALFPKYTKIQAEMTRNVKNAGVDVVDVGPDFFGDVIDEWDAQWTRKAPVLKDLKAEAAAIKRGDAPQ